jgi:hypothetical protein
LRGQRGQVQQLRDRIATECRFRYWLGFHLSTNLYLSFREIAPGT